ncbi:MAG: DNA-binding response regulator, partial [Chloroflexi bacterium]
MVTEARVVRVLIADDQTLFRSGLARLLEEDPRITLVGQAVDGLDAARKV